MKQRLLLFLFVACSGFSQEVNFTDPNLKTFLLNASANFSNAFDENYMPIAIDANNDGEITLAEAQAVYYLDIAFFDVNSIGGIEAFTNLKLLDASYTNLNGQTVDLSTLSNLETLRLSNCGLSAITIDGLNSLKVFFADGNNLTSFNLINQNTIESISLTSNQLTSLNLSNLPSLKYLSVNENQLTNIVLNGIPALEELFFHSNSISQINFSDFQFLRRIVGYNNNLLTVDVASNAFLNELLLSDNNIESVNFSSLNAMLTNVNLANNQINAIDITNLVSLSDLVLRNNQLSSLDVSSNQALGLLVVSNNNLTELDLSANNFLFILECANNNLTNLNVTTLNLIQQIDCSFNNLNELNLQSNPNLYFLRCNNNQLSTLNLSNIQNLIYLDFSFNPIAQIDLSEQLDLSELYATNTQLVDLNLANASFLFLARFTPNENLQSVNLKNNGFQDIFISGNDFTQAPALQFICVDEFEANYFQFYINEVNPNVIINGYCTFEPTGTFNTISGVARFDFDNDGCDDADLTVSNLQVSISNGEQNGAYLTTDGGSYAFAVPAGTYSLNANIANAEAFQITPNQSTVFFNETDGPQTATIDFCLTPVNPFADGEITVLPFSIPYIGYETYYQIIVTNNGSLPISGTVFFNFDGNLANVSTAWPFADAVTDNQVAFNINQLLPFQQRTILVALMFESDPTVALPIEDYNFSAQFVVTENDVNLDDNLFNFVQPNAEAFVENAVFCLEGDNVDASEIGEYLHYAINFRNTGTAAAPFVVLRSEMESESFDLNSIQVISATFPVTTQINGNVLEIIFDNLNLQPEDEGNVLIRMKSNSNLQPGDTVKFGTAVYFDYDTMINTNLAETTFQAAPLSIDESQMSLGVFPNPTTAKLFIETNGQTVENIAVTDLAGKQLLTSKYDGTNGIDVQSLASGIYLLSIKTNNGVTTQKFMKK